MKNIKKLIYSILKPIEKPIISKEDIRALDATCVRVATFFNDRLFNRFQYIIVSIFSILILTSCASAFRSPNAYQLTTTSEKILATTPQTQKTILVSMPLAAPGYQSNNMLYLTKDYSLTPFVNNVWNVPPSEMLLPLLTKSLENTGYFYAVIPTPSPARPDLRLDTYLVKLQQNFTQKPSVLEMSMGAVLVDNTWYNVIATKRFSVNVITQTDDPYGGVVAANIACRQLMEDISLWTIQQSALYLKKNRNH